MIPGWLCVGGERGRGDGLDGIMGIGRGTESHGMIIWIEGGYGPMMVKWHGYLSTSNELEVSVFFGRCSWHFDIYLEI